MKAWSLVVAFVLVVSVGCTTGSVAFDAPPGADGEAAGSDAGLGLGGDGDGSSSGGHNDVAPLEPEPVGSIGTSDVSYEMHWGMLDDLAAPNGDPDLVVTMDGKVTINDGDPETDEGIHVISAQLFEDDDSVDRPRGADAFAEAGGVFYPWIAWESTTTSDWDGMAFRLRWTAGTDPTVRIETSVGDWEMSASELKAHEDELSVGDAGQTLMMGQFFDLDWRVYDLAVTWGYWGEASVSGATAWQGSLSVGEGGIHIFGTTSFEDGDTVSQAADLDATVAWETTNLPGGQGYQAADAVSLNIVTPSTVSRPVVDLAIAGVSETYRLPDRPKDVTEVIDAPDGGYAKAHLHWCWFKTPDGRGAPLGM